MTGELYRAKMRVIHRFGWCWPQPCGPEQGRVWCHWCGMRGHKPADVRDPVVQERIAASIAARLAESEAGEGTA